MKPKRKSLLFLVPAGLFVVLATFVSISMTVYRPDRPVPAIEPGSAAGPSFVVQIIRPRLGLPMGGLLPPKWFGLDGQVGFDSQSAGAVVDSVGPGRLVLRAAAGELDLVVAGPGRVGAGTEVVFGILFEGRPRRLRGFPADPPVGSVAIEALPDEGGYSGRFDVEIVRCEDAVTGEPVGWPPQPIVLHGSFDQLRRGQEVGENDGR